MNTIVISKGPFSAELTEVLHKNGCDPIKTVKNPALAAAKFMGKQNIVVYEWSEDPQEETRNLQELMKQTTGLKVLLIVDEGIKEAIKVLVKYDEVKFVFKPLTRERLQIGMRMLLAEKKRPPTINIEYVNPFIESTKAIMQQMAQTDIEKKEVRIDKGLTVYGDISGVMALSGNANGFVVISMGIDTAIEIVKRMTMGDVSESDNELIEGGIMELINVISGQAQALFNQNQHHFDFTTPTMVRGKGHTINHGLHENSIVVKFETPDHKELFLQVCLKTA
ncbi:MAG: hypothetical protein A2268_02325 [Candidatus Raymondbacteria bacterium RifOxyA12_full_50_37]|uniref:Chemotaxis phosphatase CheX-like domain-containing protein n=1 Tax=Candidatus Raymondbacteria bacterium RIFOXYD12_FULL_49_13 TaxID=1817890 RepID=A0A1F7FM34_UNCRA|nr:MAG: hypothetical protein A2248_15900 [Candidatus Raymondbacteria bacterium RIFOXYA2_FULL_49_16]OGJ90588.1 MAG: hypothetical protein A2268_02325 [Candidatus Raymondbacteria bacterium RifOxyA12_full_50_37]OGJ99411.1 MAG: hypothetical protein A2453_05340 [Candidatus Raymondbacteria bacterium RIFOXYC2_FULL_50_21]OGJ99590.1 MAG: hypothetical protein A2350_06110 [Candidatus Raymondbacteria bacterium RifOxyB12_full_50_8]OGK03454.1 MAG: hypothetical protein A2487_18755 [Candidatus Raymondbacteria b